MDIVDPKIEEYIERFSSPADPLLAELAEETRQTLGSPQMLSGPIAGRLLEMLVWFGRPRRVLEIGTFSGHSALAMAGALPDDGHIDTCEISPKHAEVAQRYFDCSPFGEPHHAPPRPGARDDRPPRGRVRLRLHRRRQGRLRRLLRGGAPAARARGLIAVDNTLYSGRVLEGDTPISHFNEHVRSDPRAVRVILSVRDGITLIRRR